MLEGIKTTFLHFTEKSKEMLIPCVAFFTAVTLLVTALISYSIRTYVVFDGESKYTINSFLSSAKAVLSSSTFKSRSYKVVSAHAGKIQIAYLFPVYITMGDTTVSVDVEAGTTVEEVLASAGYTVDQYDMIEPSLDTVINSTTYIDYTNIDYITDTYTEVVPAKTVTVYSSDYKTGTEQYVNGSDGVNEVTYTSKVVNGVTVEKNIENTVVLSSAVNNKKIVGTRTSVVTSSSVKSISTLNPSAPIELDENGNPINYKKHITVQATGYTYTGNKCSTGVAPQPGYIAVNPNVIPYGTKMYIKSSDGRFIYGYAVAADTGGFIKKYPTNVDLFFGSLSECCSFGRRNVEIYILE